MQVIVEYTAENSLPAQLIFAGRQNLSILGKDGKLHCVPITYNQIEELEPFLPTKHPSNAPQPETLKKNLFQKSKSMGSGHSMVKIQYFKQEKELSQQILNGLEKFLPPLILKASVEIPILYEVIEGEPEKKCNE